MHWLETILPSLKCWCKVHQKSFCFSYHLFLYIFILWSRQSSITVIVSTHIPHSGRKGFPGVSFSWLQHNISIVTFSWWRLIVLISRWISGVTWYFVMFLLNISKQELLLNTFLFCFVLPKLNRKIIIIICLCFIEAFHVLKIHKFKQN